MNTKKRFLNDKRSQSVGITIAKIPPIERVQEALVKMDGKELNRSQISSLLREYITEEELSDYESQNEPGMQWEKGEEFMIALHKIPFSKLKLSIWTFTFDYSENYEGIETTVKYVRGACDEVRKSEHLKKLFGYVVAVGNILNGGTMKGQADGFNLDFLPKLSGLKDNTNKNLVQVICAMIKKEDESFENIKKQYPNLSEAGKVTMAETQGSLNKLKKELKDQKANLQKIMSLEDQFVKKTSELLETYSKEVENIEKEFTENLKCFQETVSYFGYAPTDSKYKNPEEFFNLISDFLSEVDRSIPKTEPKKVFNRKHEVGKKIMENSSNMDALLKELKMRANAS